MDILILIFRIFVGGIFLLSGLAKLLQPYAQTAAQVESYKLTSGLGTRLVAGSLAPLEIVLGVFLLLGILTNMAAGGIMLLLAGFTLAMISALRRKLVNDCGCFGAISSKRVSWKLVARNLVLFGFCASIFSFPPGALALDGAIVAFHSGMPYVFLVLALTFTSTLVAVKASRDRVSINNAIKSVHELGNS